jgi:site-specific DNA-methyltransferase (adenine-specific)
MMERGKNNIQKNCIYNGDCLELMPLIPDKSIDMILCDLPYGTTACKWDTIIPFEPLWEQYKRIIKDNGAIVLTASQPFTSALVMSNTKMFKYEWIWGKGRGTGFKIIKYKPLVSHENILIFGKGTIKYNPQMREREKPRVSKNKGTTRQMLVSNGKEYQAEKALDKKYPITEIQFSNNNQKDKLHPTQKPVALFEYLIKTYTSVGDTVLDNCAGSGTTGVACINTKRNYILIEKDPDYCKIAQDRIDNLQRSLL